MTQEEIQRWEDAYAESARRDFERRIYEQCAAEDEGADEFWIGGSDARG